MIGIIGAMDIEIEELLKIMENPKKNDVSGLVFYSGIISGRECTLVKCGPGKVNAAVCAQTLILKYSPEAVINIGVAGGIGKTINIGDLVVSESVVEHDMDTSALGDEKGFISGINKVYINSDKRISEILLKCSEDTGIKTHFGVIATGDEFVSDKKRMENIAESFGAIACEMEGGAIGHTAFMNGIPFSVIRAISDNADDNAKVDYREFSAKSAKRYVELLKASLPLI